LVALLRSPKSLKSTKNREAVIGNILELFAKTIRKQAEVKLSVCLCFYIHSPFYQISKSRKNEKKITFYGAR
jgi:hypothetical protein